MKWILFCGLCATGTLAFTQDVTLDSTRVSPAQAAEAPVKEVGLKETAMALREALEPSLVEVSWYFKVDELGQTPNPSWGPWRQVDVNEHILDERPYSTGGYLVSVDLVFTEEMVMHSRFIDRVVVRHKGVEVPARIEARFTADAAVLLKLEKPLSTTRPLSFVDADIPVSAPWKVRHMQEEGDWRTLLAPLSGGYMSSRHEGCFLAADGELVVSPSGEALGLTLYRRFDSLGAWKGNPALKMSELLPERDLPGHMEKFDKSLQSGLVRVTVNFRSPKQSASDNPFNYSSEESIATEANVPGVVLKDGTLLVLANLEVSAVSRITHIVADIGGKPHEAEFKGCLRDLAILVAKIEGVEGLALSESQEPLSYCTLLHCAEFQIQGEQRVCHVGPSRLFSYMRGWRDALVPLVPGGPDTTFIFDTEGRLMALPVVNLRQAKSMSGWSSSQLKPLPAHLLAKALADLPAHVDPAKVPLAEEDESRLSWMGVELQNLDSDLARQLRLSEQTNDGSFGALITYVYSGSPAEKAGLKTGMVLLKIHSDERPKPTDISDDPGGYHFENFPWNRLSEIPDAYFDQIPRPWPKVDNKLNRLLTELGVGKNYSLEVADPDGTLRRLPMVVEACPVHFDMAAPLEFESLGLTVRDLTFEVRRAYQRAAGDPGVIVSHIEPGSRAAVAGMKPWEVITHVGGQSVSSAEEFRTLVEGQEQLNFTVLWRARTRAVKIALAGD